MNAGAVSSYILSTVNRTNYLSELRQGDIVTGVTVTGDTRPLVVGRAKIETRPLLLIKAKCADGTTASVMLQNDWHVRVLGPGGVVHNITELKPGSSILGQTAAPSRHVGMPVDEYCLATVTMPPGPPVQAGASAGVSGIVETFPSPASGLYALRKSGHRNAPQAAVVHCTSADVRNRTAYAEANRQKMMALADQGINPFDIGNVPGNFIAQLVTRILGHELVRLSGAPGDRFAEAADVLTDVALQPEFPTFLTIGAYARYLVDDESLAAATAPLALAG